MSVSIQSQSVDNNFKGVVGDDHNLSYKAIKYAETEFKNKYKTSFESVNNGIIFLDLSKVVWKTSKRAKRRHGVSKYKSNNVTHIVLSEKTFEKGGFESIKTTIRHELAHAFQYQHKDKQLDVNNIININTDHKESFKYFDTEWDLQGRCSSYYTTEKNDYEYVVECPSCNNWWGRHRLCKTIRQSVTQNRYCSTCDVYLYVVDPETGNTLDYKSDANPELQKDKLNTIIKQFYENDSDTYTHISDRVIKFV